MDCERLEALAIDLVYDELEARARADAEQHLSGCPRCQSIVDRLRAGRRAADQIELEVPSSDLESRIFEAEVATRRTSPWPRRLARAISAAGSYAMRPQVAMAAVVMVMVGISVVMLRSGAPTAHRTSESDEGAPLQVDKAEQKQAPAQMIEAENGKSAEKSAEKNDLANADGQDQKQNADSPAAAPSFAPGVPALAQDVDKLAKEESPAKKALGPSTLDTDGDALDESAHAVGKGAGGSPPPTPTTIAGAAAATTSTTSPASYDAAIAAYSAGKYADAQKGFDAAFAAGTKPSSSLLYSARARRALGNCADALPRFKRVLSDYSSSADAPNAALEGGECARNLGDLAAAKALFQQAAQYPSTKSRADAGLASLSAPTATATTMPAPAAKPPSPKAKMSDANIHTDE